MLYMISVHMPGTLGLHKEFHKSLDALGQNTEVFPGTYLVNCSYTALGIRNALARHLGQNDSILIAKMLSGYCAGKLDTKAREFMLQGN
ncbi:MAG: hypothetical protein LBS18_08400 [Clostridiales bacterium]|jgi:hypothetical protein|nr:hypothetical protein [Clostridiales bacterium]